MTKKKKIGIVTYWESNDNYGQQLQCWALQHYLRSLGHNAFLIRQYVWPPVKKNGVKKIKQLVKDKIADFLYFTNLAYSPRVNKYFAFCLDKEACIRQFPKFRKDNLKMSRIFDTPEKLKNNPPKAEVYITGSDQVWNYTMPEGPLSNFFLQFGNEKTKRISYAPSIGHPDFDTEFREKIQNYLSKFAAISVREGSAVKLINDLGYEATHVLDPTMLLKADDYLQLAPQNIVKEESIYIYSMNYASADDIPFNVIKQYAQQENLPIIVTPGSGFLPAKELFEDVEYSYDSIAGWIQHIINAKLFITASFHGIVFAILFHKPFVYTPIKGKHSSSNNRVLDLLGQLGLEQCVLKGEIDLSPKINWEIVDEKLNEMRKVSMNYLEKNI